MKTLMFKRRSCDAISQVGMPFLITTPSDFVTGPSGNHQIGCNFFQTQPADQARRATTKSAIPIPYSAATARVRSARPFRRARTKSSATATNPAASTSQPGRMPASRSNAT